MCVSCNSENRTKEQSVFLDLHLNGIVYINPVQNKSTISGGLYVVNHLYILCVFSSRRYSPVSDWLKQTTAENSQVRVCSVDRDVTPNPKGMPLMDSTTTPWYAGVPSVILPIAALIMLFPYKKLWFFSKKEMGGLIGKFERGFKKKGYM